MTQFVSNPAAPPVATIDGPVAFVKPKMSLDGLPLLRDDDGNWEWPKDRDSQETIGRLVLANFDVTGMLLRSAQLVYDDESNTLCISFGMADLHDVTESHDIWALG